MNRLEFLQVTGAAFAGLPSAVSRPPSAASRIRPIGIQLYTVREAMQHDFDGTLERVARIGYHEVEFAGYFNNTPAQIRDALRRHHLTAPSKHWDVAEIIGPNLSSIIDASHTAGHHYITGAWIDERLRRNIDGYRRVADALNTAGQQIRQAGLQLAYHNHSYEFETMDGQLPYDVLVDHTDPSLMQLEIDLYWITKGGKDPLDYFARFPGRISMVHVKDVTAAGEMTDVGSGVIDWRRIFARHAQAGIRHYFVEHDFEQGAPPNIFDHISSSYRYLSRLDV